ncbi:hypothetical protein GQR58_011347 [Nymphon striatum]|nr:hypothetical protein GQR58_011347 [Nymphon striatum]
MGYPDAAVRCRYDLFIDGRRHFSLNLHTLKYNNSNHSNRVNYKILTNLLSSVKNKPKANTYATEIEALICTDLLKGVCKCPSFQPTRQYKQDILVVCSREVACWAKHYLIDRKLVNLGKYAVLLQAPSHYLLR